MLMRGVLKKFRQVFAILSGVAVGVGAFFFIGEFYVDFIAPGNLTVSEGFICYSSITGFFLTVIHISVLILGLIVSLYSGNAVAELLDPSIREFNRSAVRIRQT